MKQPELLKSIEPDAVRTQLAVILASDGFVRARRMQRFLEFIVEEALAGRAAQLGEYAIGLSVFDRNSDFDPALDPIVRNDARRLRAKLLEYFRQEARPSDIVIEVPKGGYVPLFHTVRPVAPSLEPQVSHMINGCIVSSGDRCRVILHLTDATQDGLRTRELAFDLGRHEIVTGIAHQVKFRLSHEQPRPPVLAVAA